MTTQFTELPWNLVTKNLHGHEMLRKKLREKIFKLEKHLTHFPADTVHLHIALERHPRKVLHTAALTLRVPSNILHSKKSASNVVKAFDDAVKALLRELVALKSELRREVFWKRKARRSRLRDIKASGFTVQPQAEGMGPQSEAEVVRDLLKQHGQRLLRYVRRNLWHVMTTSEVTAGAFDADAIVDEVARRALTAPEKKPSQAGYLIWLYMLAWQEIARRRRGLRRQAQEAQSLEAPQISNDDAAAIAGYDPEQPLDLIEMELEPPVAETKVLLPDMQAEPPDVIVGRQELLAQIRKTANAWSNPEREVFELYFVEGFEPEEVAMVVGQRISQVRELIAHIQWRLRKEVLEQALV